MRLKSYRVGLTFPPDYARRSPKLAAESANHAQIVCELTT